MEEELRTAKNDAVNDIDDDDPPALSSHALAALKEFLEEQSQSLANHESVETGGAGETGTESEVALVTEDWRLSQFWYDPETARTVAQEVLSLCSESDYKVACIACPTLYAYLKVLLSNPSSIFFFKFFTSSFGKND